MSNERGTNHRKAKPKRLTPSIMAQAIRIAAKMAKEQPNANPLFVEALEAAAAHFDNLAQPKKPSSELRKCLKCEKPPAPSKRKGAGGFSQYCMAHLIAQREYNRNRLGSKRRNLGAPSYQGVL